MPHRLKSSSNISTDAIRADWRLAARLIDHTLLKPDATRAQITQLCREAADYVGFTIPDHFVVGYGMDYAERYRNLPDIRVLPSGENLEGAPS